MGRKKLDKSQEKPSPKNDKKEKISHIKISSIKSQIKPIFISSFFPLKIKNNSKSKKLKYS